MSAPGEADLSAGPRPAPPSLRPAPRRAPAAYQAAPAEEDDSALVVRYRALIDRVTRRVAQKSGGAVGAAELFSAAALGLIAARQRFDPSREVSFEVFAEHRVRGAVLDELREMDPLPRRLRHDADAVRRAQARLEQQLGREATIDEVAAACGKSCDEVAGLQQVVKPAEPLDEVFAGALASGEASAEARLVHRQLTQRVSAEVGRLAPRLQTLLQLHYVEGLSYREIGEVLEVSEARICQLHKEALGALKAALKEAEGR